MSHTIPLSRYQELLVTSLAPQRRAVLLLGLGLLGNTGLQLLAPQLLRQVIDTALGAGPTRAVMTAALLYLGVTLANQALGVAVGWGSGEVGWRATNRLRGDLVRHCLRLDLPFHHATSPGALIERIDGDVGALNDFFSTFVLRLLGSALLLAGVLVALAREDWRVGLALGLFVAVALAVLGRTRGLAVAQNRAEREASADLFGALEERLGGIEDLRANGAGAYVLSRYHPIMHRAFITGRRAAMRAGAINTIGIALFALGTALALGLGVYFHWAGAFTVGTVFLIFRYTHLLERPLQQITRQIEDLQRASAGLLRVGELLETRSRLRDGGGAALPPGPLAVSFDRVSFGYAGPDAADRTIEGVSFALAPGQVLGLLGRTGSGKTTIARLLLRLYDPAAGRIALGGVDLRDLPLAEVRARIGVVTQDVHLFGATVRDNLTLFGDDIPDDRLIATLRDLGLGPWHDALPDGLDTPLAAGGGLSAGEAQLLAFARVFLRDPGLVILDEASSRLDPATERLIERAIDRLFAGRSGIVIAHRLTTVARADQIVILEGGRVAESGPRDALAADPGSRFARLLRFGREEVPA